MQDGPLRGRIQGSRTTDEGLTAAHLPVISVLEQSLRFGPLKARRMGCHVSLVVFWRMRGEVQPPRNFAPGHGRYDSSLWNRRADRELPFY
jgi:hypothetical protein